MRRAFAAVAVVAATFSLAFLVVPVVALFVHVPPGDLLHALGTPAARDALVVSAKTSAIAHVAVLVIGTPAAYAIGRSRFRGRGVFFAVMLSTMMIPQSVLIVAQFILFRWLDLHTPIQFLGTFKPLWLPARFRCSSERTP